MSDVYEFSPSVLRHAPWSFSKSGALEKCGRQYRFGYVERRPKILPGHASSRIGTAGHAVLEHMLREGAPRAELDDRLAHAAEEEALTLDETDKLIDLAGNIERYLKFHERFLGQAGVSQTFIEHQMAINPVYAPVAFDAKDALMKGVLDIAYLTGNNDMVILDHKSGVYKPLCDHEDQLNVYRVFVAAAFPQIRAVQAGIHHIAYGKIELAKPMYRDEIVEKLYPWLMGFLNRHAKKLSLLDAAVAAGVETDGEVGWQCRFCSYAVPGVCDVGRASVEEYHAKRGTPPPAI